jgi:tRNA-binding protein
VYEALGSSQTSGTERNYITIEEFSRIDLRVGKVVSAERIPGTRLLRLIVDIGSERRQIIAGLGEFYAPEDFIGKTVVIVANLKPKRIRGYISEGMLLAAGCEKGQKPVPLTAEGAEPGWKVC